MRNQKAMMDAQKRWNAIAHPLHSLGKMERDIIRIAGMTGDSQMHLHKRALVIMCADNGVVEEKISQTGKEVTAIVAENFLSGKTTAAIMCAAAGVDILPIDIGMAVDTKVRNCKVAYGTNNFFKERAMSVDQARQAVQTGIDLVGEYHAQGYGILATGEMGIGNTTTSSAMASVLLHRPVEEMTGRGAGLSDEGLERKIRVIQEALAFHRPKESDVWDVLSAVGGFDIAGLAGVFLGGEKYHIPILLDGFISGVAALVASRISPSATEYMIATHISKEPATRQVLDALGLDAGLHMDMCLGEGTGAVAYIPLLDMAVQVYEGMVTFDDDQIDEYEEFKK